MKVAMIAGVALILLGIMGLVTGGYDYTHEKKVIDMGPVQVEHKETSRVPVSPFLGGFAIVAGIILVAVGNKANTSLL